MQKKPSIWALADNRPGNVTQSIGVASALAQRLHCEYEIQPIHYDAWVKLPNILRGRSLWGVAADSRGHFQNLRNEDCPDYIISAGRRAAPILRYLKSRWGPHVTTIQLMRPEAGYQDFDWVFVPQHDHAPSHKNVVKVLGTPHRLAPAKFTEAAKAWEHHFMNLPKPWIVLLVGGASKAGKLSPRDAMRLGQAANELAQHHGGSLLVSTSRRTSLESSMALEDALTVPHYFHSWGKKAENPYLGFLALGDVMIVTGDSMSMCTEACATQKPVYIYDAANVSNKHRQFHEALYSHGCARPFAYGDRPDLTWQPAILDTAGHIADIILRAKEFESSVEG